MSDIELSICIPTYKGGKMLKACVEEILGYEGSEIEVVVSDNASNDGSIEALQEIKDDRLKIYVNESNCGPYRNWYRALQRGNGRYLMILQDNDHLIVENLPTYLSFIRGINYDVIKNAYSNREGITGPVTCAKWLFYSVVLSHVSYVAYRREVFRNLKPLEESFMVEWCAYPCYIWDMQILNQYSVMRKVCYINGNIEIVRLSKFSKKMPSRTRSGLLGKKIPTSYTFDNAVYYFDKHIKLLKTMYPEEKMFNIVYCNLYRGFLFKATIDFYEHMINPQSKERYGVYVENEEDIDYMRLNNIFLSYALKREELQHKTLGLYIRLYLITYQNKLLFKLNHVYKRNFTNPKYFCGCVVNKFLKKIINYVS